MIKIIQNKFYFPILSILLALLISGHFFATAQANTFLADLESKLPKNISPVMFVNGLEQGSLIVSHNENARSEFVSDPNGQFSSFLRAHIPNKGESSYAVTARSLRNSSDVKKGDWVLASFYVRAAPGSGSINIRGFIERTQPSWMMVADASIAATEKWKRVVAVGRAPTDLPQNSIHLSLHLASKVQTVDIANLVFLSLPAQTPTHIFPPTELTYEGMDKNAKWRKQAEQMIRTHRTGEFTLYVLDHLGKPVGDRRIAIEQQDIDFELASMVGPQYTENTPLGTDYNKWFNSLFNSATARIYWADWGWENPKVREEYLRSMAKLQQEQVSTRGHVLLYPAFRFSPKSLNRLANNKQAFINRVNQHIDEMVPILKAYGVNEYDVINELRDEAEWLDIVGLDTVADWFKRVHSLHPEAILYINENSILTDGGENKNQQDHYYETINYLLKKGAPIHGIGMQGHFSGVVTPVEKMWQILDRFAKFDLPIRITEYDSNTRDLKAQAQFDTDFYTAMYAHPATVGVTRWGFYEPKMWRPLGALVDAKGAMKPNAVSYLAWLNALKSNKQTLRLNSNGAAQFSGHFGAYKIRVAGESKELICDFIKPLATIKSNNAVSQPSCTVRLPE